MKRLIQKLLTPIILRVTQEKEEKNLTKAIAEADPLCRRLVHQGGCF